MRKRVNQNRMHKTVYIFLSIILTACSGSDSNMKSALIGKWNEKLPETVHFVLLYHFYNFTADSFFVRTTYTDDTRMDVEINLGKGIYTFDKSNIILVGKFYSSHSARNLVVYSDSLKKEIMVPDTVQIPLVSDNFINLKYKYRFNADTLIFSDSLNSNEYYFLRD